MVNWTKAEKTLKNYEFAPRWHIPDVPKRYMCHSRVFAVCFLVTYNQCTPPPPPGMPMHSLRCPCMDAQVSPPLATTHSTHYLLAIHRPGGAPSLPEKGGLGANPK